MFSSSISHFVVLAVLSVVDAQLPFWGPSPHTNVSPFGPPPLPPNSNGKTCTVHALGNGADDTPQILGAFEECNHGGTVVFPSDQTYLIATRLNPVIHDVTIHWKGTWLLSDNLTYWRENSYPVAFQNHQAGFIITGSRIHINGFNTGGIDGNGNAWYNAEKNVTLFGRPFPFVFWNVSEVLVEHFFVKDPPLWSLNIMNGTNLHFDDMVNNATAINQPYGISWVQNTDGFDTMDVKNVALTNFVYQGGDDCIAIKPRSYGVYVQNITCYGGSGMAIGSLGQYLEDSSVIDVLVKDAVMIKHKDFLAHGPYIKTWIGELAPQDSSGNSYENAGQPRGGGWGVVKNIRFENFDIQGAATGFAISQDSGDILNGTYKGTSNMEISNIEFVNVTGYMEGGITSHGIPVNYSNPTVSCSSRHPCFGIVLDDVRFAGGKEGREKPAVGTCSYVREGGVRGLVGC